MKAKKRVEITHGFVALGCLRCDGSDPSPSTPPMSTKGERLFQARTGSEERWIQTMPGKGWFVYRRLYGPIGPTFDGTWRILKK